MERRLRVEKKIGFGVIGLGMGVGHCATISNTEGARLVAVSDLLKEKREKIAQEYGIAPYEDYRQMLEKEDMDVVMICTPSGMHGEIAIESARAGKHILSEKPIEITLEKAERMIEECRKAKVKLGINFQNRFLEGNWKTKKIIEEGKLGDLVLGEVRLKYYRTQEYYDKGGWRGTWKMDGGGAIMNQTIHQIDLLQWLMGEVETVFARTKAIAHRMETEDIGTALLEFKNGALGTIVGTTAVYPELGSRIEVHGKNGTAVTVNGKIETLEFMNEDKEISLGKFPRNPVEDMVESILNDREPLINGEEAKKSLKIVLAIYKSSREGKPVKV
jgi:predicted dehydrogenase